MACPIYHYWERVIYSLQFSFNLTKSDTELYYTTFNLNSGDHNNLRSQMQHINRGGMLNMTMDEAWEFFLIEFDAFINNSVPLSAIYPSIRIFT